MYSRTELDKARAIVYKLTGITLGESKDIMIKNRLDKLTTELPQYKNTITSLLMDVDNGKYEEEFINCFTTNKTHFFRECFHFDDLLGRVLPELMAKGNDVKIYCSASSTGEEPYSIAMTVNEAKEKEGKRYFKADILATDIDTNVLNVAKEGVYKFGAMNVHEFPSWISLPKYFLRRSIPHIQDSYLVKAKDSLRSQVVFKEMNLMDERYPYSNHQFDVIFCRNVLIYFTPQDQTTILRKLFSHLKIGGTLYIGHSESPLGLHNYIERMGQNIFVKVRDIG